MERERVERVLVVGGGDAGLMTALTFRVKNPNLPITVVDDFEEPIPGIGKSTTNYILKSLHDVLDIDRQRFVTKVKPVWKASVYFEDWCGCEPFHVPFDDSSIRPRADGSECFEELYYRHETRNFRTLGGELAEQSKSPFSIQSPGGLQVYQDVAYHLGIRRFNEFLRELCKERTIELVNDRITEVSADEETIVAVRSDDATYEADLYVDATGFQRSLVSELDRQFREFEYPLDSAVVSKLDLSLADIVPATVVTSGEHGWFWQIDTYDWRDVGYVYSSGHVSDEAATKAFLNEHETLSEEDLKHYRFDTGYFKEPWRGNCLPVGNALGFVEPLQSTALTTNALLVEKLASLLASHHRLNHPGVREIYNTYVQSIWENVYDFISIHYRHASDDSEFWAAMREIERGEHLDQYLANYHENGFNSHHDFNQWQFTHDNLYYRVFTQWQFYRVLRHLGIESEFYRNLDVQVSEDVVERVEKQTEDQAREAKQHPSYDELSEYGIY